MRSLGIGKETTFKSGATPDLWLDLIGHSVSVRRENLWMESAWRRTPHTMLGGPYVVEGDIDLILTPHGTARLLYLAMGRLFSTSPDDEGNPVAYSHEIKIAYDELPTAEFDLFFDEKRLVIFGAVVRRLELSFVARELAAATVGILGAKVLPATGGGGTPEAEKPWFPSNIIVERNGEVVTEKVQALRVTIENSVADDAHVLGSLELPKMFTQGVEITGEIEWQFESWSEYERFLGGSEPIQEVSPVEYVIKVSGSETGSSVPGFEHYSMEIDLPRCFITESDVHFTRRERVIQRIAFKAASRHNDDIAPMRAIIKTTRDTP